MKKAVLLCAMLIFILLPSITLTVYAHPGRTDGSGGHTDHSTGEYHYHHGYPAHDHYDMDGDGIVDCPYDFDDKTDRSSGNNSRGDSDVGGNVKSDTKKDGSNSSKNSLADILVTILEHLFWGIAIWIFSSYFLSYIVF